MAYMDFNNGFAVAQKMSAAAADTLTPLEWQVVAMARHDRLSSLDAPGLFSRIAARVLGDRPVAALADRRLEALRRLAVTMWHKGIVLPPYEIEAAKAAGYTPGQMEALWTAIGRARAARPVRG